MFGSNRPQFGFINAKYRLPLCWDNIQPDFVGVEPLIYTLPNTPWIGTRPNLTLTQKKAPTAGLDHNEKAKYTKNENVKLRDTKIKG